MPTGSGWRFGPSYSLTMTRPNHQVSYTLQENEKDCRFLTEAVPGFILDYHVVMEDFELRDMYLGSLSGFSRSISGNRGDIETQIRCHFLRVFDECENRAKALASSYANNQSRSKRSSLLERVIVVFFCVSVFGFRSMLGGGSGTESSDGGLVERNMRASRSAVPSVTQSSATAISPHPVDPNSGVTPTKQNEKETKTAANSPAELAETQDLQLDQPILADLVVD